MYESVLVTDINRLREITVSVCNPASATDCVTLPAQFTGRALVKMAQSKPQVSLSGDRRRVTRVSHAKIRNASKDSPSCDLYFVPHGLKQSFDSLASLVFLACWWVMLFAARIWSKHGNQSSSERMHSGRVHSLKHVYNS